MKFTAALALLCASSATAFRPLSTPTASKTSLFLSDQGMLEEKEARMTEQLNRSPVGRRGGGMTSLNPALGDLPPFDPTDIFYDSDQTTVQGGSLRTWSFANPRIEFVQVMMKTEGRPLDADVQLWQGPDNTPHKLKVYVEDGGLRTFCALIGTPNGPNTLAIRNTGMLEFPLSAVVKPDRDQGQDAALAIESLGMAETIQGGALRTYPFSSEVDSVAILLKTDGRPLNSRIELLQGPNNNKQVIELYTEDGLDRPFFAIVETPGSGNVVRVVNTAPVEFPLAASVQAYSLGGERGWGDDGIQMGRNW